MATYYVNIGQTGGGGAGTTANPWGPNAIDKSFGFGLQISDAGTNNRTIKAGDTVICTGTLNRWQGLQLMGVGGNGTDFDKIDYCAIEDFNLNNYIQIISQGAVVNGANWGTIKLGSDGTRGTKFLRVSGFEVTFDPSFISGTYNCDAHTYFANGNNGVQSSDGIVVSGFNNSPVHHVIVDNNHCHGFSHGSGINVTLDFNGTSQQSSWDYVRVESNEVHDCGRYDARGPQGITALKGANLAGTPATDVKLYVLKNTCYRIVQDVNSRAISLPYITDGHGFLFGGFNNGKTGVAICDSNIAYDCGAAGFGFIECQGLRWKIRNNTASNCGWHVNGFSGTIQGQRISACNCAWNGSYTAVGPCYTDDGAFSITGFNGFPTIVDEFCNNLAIQPQGVIQKGFKVGGVTTISNVSDNWAYQASSNDLAIVGSSDPMLGGAGSSSPWCPADNSPLLEAGHVPSAPTPCCDVFGEPVAAPFTIGACHGNREIVECSITGVPDLCANEEWNINLNLYGTGPFTHDDTVYYDGGFNNATGVWNGANAGAIGGQKEISVTDGNGGYCTIILNVIDCPSNSGCPGGQIVTVS